MQKKHPGICHAIRSQPQGKAASMALMLGESCYFNATRMSRQNSSSIGRGAVVEILCSSAS